MADRQRRVCLEIGRVAIRSFIALFLSWKRLAALSLWLRFPSGIASLRLRSQRTIGKRSSSIFSPTDCRTGPRGLIPV
jgi:hypothetical protein